MSQVDELKKTLDKVLETAASTEGKIANVEIALVKFIAGRDSCKEKCESSYSAVFGNGKIGLKTKMFVVWGALCFTVPAVITLVVNMMLHHL